MKKKTSSKYTYREPSQPQKPQGMLSLFNFVIKFYLVYRDFRNLQEKAAKYCSETPIFTGHQI